MTRAFTVTSTVALGIAMLCGAGTAPAADEGQLAFNNHCRTCHSIREGDNRLGPTLHGIVGKKAGTQPGYAAYSQALKGSGVVWNEKTLDAFIENPEQVIRNNNMKPYAGLPDPEVRQSIIDYLETLRPDS